MSARRGGGKKVPIGVPLLPVGLAIVLAILIVVAISRSRPQP